MHWAKVWKPLVRYGALNSREVEWRILTRWPLGGTRWKIGWARCPGATGRSNWRGRGPVVGRAFPSFLWPFAYLDHRLLICRMAMIWAPCTYPHRPEEWEAGGFGGICIVLTVQASHWGFCWVGCKLNGFWEVEWEYRAEPAWLKASRVWGNGSRKVRNLVGRENVEKEVVV